MKWKDKYGWLVEWLDKKREEARSELKKRKTRKSCRHNNHREKTLVAVEPIKKVSIVEKIEEPVVVAFKLPVESNSPVRSSSSVENIVVKENEPQNIREEITVERADELNIIDEIAAERANELYIIKKLQWN
jgi:hypothetical protein